MNGWYKTSNGIRYEFWSSDLINFSGRDIVELFIPNGVIGVNFDNNQLTELIIPDQVEYISCKGNNITELIVPDDCIVRCDESCKVITKTMYNRFNRLKAILK
jgi:hypothetical protein